jgi:hypothetical protein
MSQIIKLRRSAIPGRTPTTSSLDFGELAMNTYDGKLFMKKSGSSGEEVIEIGSATNFSGSFSGSLYGTASWAENSITSSYAIFSLSSINAETASFTPNAYVSSSQPTDDSIQLVKGDGTFETYIINYINNAISASYSETASYALNAQGSGFPFTGSAVITGSLVVTGSIIATNGVTASLLGTASYALGGSGSFSGSFSGNGAGITNISASNIVGLTLSQITSGSVTASVDPINGFRVNADSKFTGSTQITGSLGVTGSISIDNTQGTIFYSNADTLVFTGSYYQSGSFDLSGSMIVTSGVTASLFGTASRSLTASYVDGGFY